MKCKGLIFRELYLGRKNMLIITLVWCMWVALGILAQLSFLYGNLGRMSEDEINRSLVLSVFTYSPTAILMVAAMDGSNVIFADYATKWNVFRTTTPLSAERYAGVICGITVCKLAVAFGLNVGNAAILARISDTSLNRMFFTYTLGIVVLAAFCCVVSNQLAYKYKTKNKATTKGMLLWIPIYGLLMGGFTFGVTHYQKAHPELSGDTAMEQFTAMCKDYGKDYVAFLSAHIWILPLATAAVLAVGYVLDVKAMKRREY